jgi:hypothetical protein
MSLDSHDQLPGAIDSTAYPIWRRQCDGNRALFKSYGKPHTLRNIGQLYFKNAEESARR